MTFVPNAHILEALCVVPFPANVCAVVDVVAVIRRNGSVARGERFKVAIADLLTKGSLKVKCYQRNSFQLDGPRGGGGNGPWKVLLENNRKKKTESSLSLFRDCSVPTVHFSLQREKYRVPPLSSFPCPGFSFLVPVFLFSARVPTLKGWRSGNYGWLFLFLSFVRCSTGAV